MGWGTGLYWAGVNQARGSWVFVCAEQLPLGVCVTVYSWPTFTIAVNPNNFGRILWITGLEHCNSLPAVCSVSILNPRVSL
jgi:hypothetical protein